MAVGGWIKLYRKFLDWEWFTDSKMVQLFIYLLLSASIEERKWKGIVLERGQLATTYPELSKRTRLTVQNLRTALQRLEDAQIISRKVTNKYTLISICNYESYQAKEDAEQQATNSQTTGNQQATNSQTTGTIAEEGEEGIKREEDITTTTTILVNTIPRTHAGARDKFDFYSLTEEEQAAEKSAFFQVFYWANYRFPGKELEKFINKNQAAGWTAKESGTVFDTKAQRVALAGMWVAADPTMKDRDKEINLLKWLYEEIKKVRPDLAQWCIDTRNGIETSSDGTTLILHYGTSLCNFLRDDEKGQAIVKTCCNPKLKIQFSNKAMRRNLF